MEDVLELYEEPYDPKKPVVCFDELPFQLVAETRTPLPSKPGYAHSVTTTSTSAEGHGQRVRHLRAQGLPTPPGSHRAAHRGVDFALAMRRLADEYYPEAEKIRVVLDNLNTHTGASLYRAFEPAEARRILRRLEFHHTPKHASWLNQVKVELSVLSRQCLSGRRIPDQEMLAGEAAAWESERNERGATVDWRFTATDAREKLARLYPAQS